jgi:hypothetical protein
MTETVYMDGEELVREIRTPLNPEPVPEDVLAGYEAIWPQVLEQEWTDVPPTVRLEVLIYAAKGGGDLAEAVVDIHLGVVPNLMDEFKPRAHEFMWALVGADDLDADLIAFQVMSLILELAAEAKAELRAGISRLHDWRLGLYGGFERLHSDVIEAIADRMQVEWFEDVDVDAAFSDFTCSCCSEIYPPAEAKRASVRMIYTEVFCQMLSILQEHEERFNDLDLFEYGIVWKNNQ